MVRNIKKFLRFCILLFIILLASAGVGIAGGVPPVSGNRKNEKSDIKIELFELRKEEKETESVEEKL